ncbi:hypothetical protein [Actinoplanes regularis]|uniref:Uncharacterized protein n=1 Tax=Actinoplanes regularis TaxID=52697 RepID=A0A238YEC5_9ACTN|nr:hypothetical protein [Actinoplanes regularis]GIE86007.1 hypothetical protein Are01nite_24870 [Actinoplanes regularis]SNR68709.1 hypothetical protein SAMN06264365_104441 [Actinoplanes regularis]
MHRGDWLTDQIRKFDQLRGRRIESWTGVEMALREDVGGSPRFEDATVPFLQLAPLTARLDDGTFFTVDTDQGDRSWGLLPNPGAPGTSTDPGGIFRLRSLPELPLGEVDAVSAFLDDDVLAEVLIRIQGRSLLLMAGEVYEQWDGGLSFVRHDESVLVFTDPSAAESIDWLPERRKRDFGQR